MPPFSLPGLHHPEGSPSGPQAERVEDHVEPFVRQVGMASFHPHSPGQSSVTSPEEPGKGARKKCWRDPRPASGFQESS